MLTLIIIGTVVFSAASLVSFQLGETRYTFKTAKEFNALTANPVYRSIALPAAAERKALPSGEVEEPVLETSVNMMQVEKYVESSSLPYALRNKATRLIERFNSVPRGGLSIEDSHDLDVVGEQLLSAVRLYEALPEDKRGSRTVTRELDEQLTMLDSVISTVSDDQANEVMKQLRSGTQFLKDKFMQRQRMQLKK
jgi:hypothetical protein